MKKHSFKLSICMMVKNEETNLRRCLNSLESLLKRSDIELIIVDTGSSDHTPEIASEYTSNIFHHLWNNNFSDMRNITISYAKGEWILILDADEELLDQQQLIGLLKDNRLSNFNTVQFTMHDYVKSTDSTNYLKYSSYRMFKNDGTFKYEGAVHNQPSMKGPILLAPVILNHYGYQFDNKELLERKFQRTASILLNELEKEPNNIYYRYQLANSYYIHGDSEKALEEIRIAYTNLKALPLEKRAKHPYVYAEYGRESYANREYQECIEICLEGISLLPEYIDLHYYISLAYQTLRKPNEAIKHALRHLELVNSFDNLEITKDASVIMMGADLYSVNASHTVLANQYYETAKYDQALEYALKMVDSKEKTQFLLSIYFKLECYKEIEIYYKTLEDEQKKEFIEQLEYQRENMSISQREAVNKVFASGDDDYAILNKIRNSTGEIGVILSKEFIKSTDFRDKNVYYADAFRNFSRDHKEIVATFKKMQSSKIKVFIKYLIDHYTVVEESLHSYLRDNAIRKSDYEGNRVYACIANVLLLNAIEGAREEKYRIERVYLDLFQQYYEYSVNRISQVYQMDRIKLIYSTLEQEEDRFILLLNFAKEAINKGNYKSGIKYFKEAVEGYPYLTMVLDTFREELFSSIDVGMDEVK
ncbi:glycosyltransferase [Paenibacillus sp. P36]|uniref:glycosyltransferase n=1 Tax=Paenibacillus sp. P36 TaxID=3342538 RepID=UPI0038B32601